MGSVSLRPPLLGPEQPRWDFVRPGSDSSGGGSGGERLLITVCVHGNEPCGLLAVNELLEEGFFDSAAGEGTWPHTWDRLTVLLGNPAGLTADKRFIDCNLNRLFLPEAECRGSSSSASTVEQARVPELAAAIAQSTAHVDIHSSSAPSVPFCFHFPGDEAAAFAASFPIAFAIEDASIRGTTIHWAHQQVRPRSILVECGQHDARQSVEVAKRCIRRLVLGPGWQRGHPAAQAAAAHPQQQPSASALEPTQALTAAPTQAAEPATQPSAAAGAGAAQAAAEPVELAVEPAQALRTAGSVYVGSGFRWRRDVTAFQLVSRGDVIAEDDRQGAISCPHDTARIVMPTHLPVAGEEAWLWGVEA